ncbi:MAG TPA: hypothetical protein PLX08_13815 [Bacteroidales bacterium]|mgnify:CR=1 FL=1|jgi:hypothetical protein|nr:hypothetical protein [Bacteroidales bacterium]
MIKKSLFIISVTLLTSAISLTGQTTAISAEKELAGLFTRLAAFDDDSSKLAVNDSITSIIDSYVSSDSVIKHTLQGVKYLGQITDGNHQMKIIAWNLILNESKSRYYCYFINNSGKVPVVRKLTAIYNEETVRTDTQYSEENWYGALYYDLKAIRKDRKTYWILLGIDYGNPSVTRKIIDVLNFSPDGQVQFGDKIFESGKVLKYREVLEYSSEAVISLKFLNDRTIVFDHLVPMSPRLKGQKEFYGPDFSYDSYTLEKGIWKFESNIDVRNKKKN